VELLEGRKFVEETLPLTPDSAHGPQSQPEELVSGATEQSVHLRGIALLRENLSGEQLRQYDATQYFDVIGGKTGTRYRIWSGCERNIHAPVGQEGIDVLCFHPSERLSVGDVMLVQKIALEIFELDAIRIANRFRLLEPDGTPYYPWRDTARAYAAWHGTSYNRDRGARS
jgi:hypothetical protein